MFVTWKVLEFFSKVNISLKNLPIIGDFSPNYEKLFTFCVKCLNSGHQCISLHLCSSTHQYARLKWIISLSECSILVLRSSYFTLRCKPETWRLTERMKFTTTTSGNRAMPLIPTWQANGETTWCEIKPHTQMSNQKYFNNEQATTFTLNFHIN